MKLKDKSALITGASVGIGRATALRFAKEGAKLILLDIDYEKLIKVKDEAGKYTKDILIYKCDVSNEEDVEKVVKEAEGAFGRIDILVNNAALWRGWRSFLDTPFSEWRKFIDVNIMGVVYMTKAVLSGMVERNYGRIINVASVAGVYGNGNMTHYSATKGAVISMTKALAKEVADKGVLVNAVSPGTVSPSENLDVNFNEPSDFSYIGRSGTDAENANLILFLASDESSYISGQNIQIDGCRRKM